MTSADFYFDDIETAAKVYSEGCRGAGCHGRQADFTLRITTEVPTPYLPGIGT